MNFDFHQLDLTIVWGFIIVLAVFIYVVLDGFDLGIGILFNIFPVGHDRDTAMNSIAPVWDGNETWLVMGGGWIAGGFSLGVWFDSVGPLCTHHCNVACLSFSGCRI